MNHPVVDKAYDFIWQFVRELRHQHEAEPPLASEKGGSAQLSENIGHLFDGVPAEEFLNLFHQVNTLPSS